MRVIIASSESIPFAKTGGLGDVVGMLADELKKLRVDSAVILPFYRRIKTMTKTFGIKDTRKEFTVRLGDCVEKGRLWKGMTPKGTDAYFIENDRFYDRDELYGIDGKDYPDNASRFIFYSRGVIEAIKVLGLDVDVIHCNDWQSGLIPVYLKTIYKEDFPETATIMTIHNIGFQGLFWHWDMPLTGLDWEFFNMDALEFYGKINLLKGGIIFSDIITTVSNTYAKEITTPEYGFGLDGVLIKRKDVLYGVINGIDYNEWSPWKDGLIPARYNRKNLNNKARCKALLKEECGLKEGNTPLIGMVSRLTSQKGVEIVLNSMDRIMDSGAQMVILGSGTDSIENQLLSLHDRYKGNLFVKTGFNNDLAHRIYAGSDIFLMPSRYEPCGLSQLIAMSYGTIPVVRRTGGLADTVTEYNPVTKDGTGFLFDEYSPDAMLTAIIRALRLYNNKETWQRIMLNAMSLRFTWQQSAKEYIKLYRMALKKHQ